MTPQQNPTSRRLLAPVAVAAAVLVVLLGPAALAAPLAPGPAAPVPSEPLPADARFTWPLEPEPPVLRPFEPPPDPYGPGHRGVDLGAYPGQPVLAAGSGVVVFAGELAGRGVVSVDHDALRTTYEPVRAGVRVGDQVYGGQQIGTVARGHAGCTDACLHWGVRRGDPPEYLNPLELVAEGPQIRLKPWDG